MSNSVIQQDGKSIFLSVQSKNGNEFTQNLNFGNIFALVFHCAFLRLFFTSGLEFWLLNVFCALLSDIRSNRFTGSFPIFSRLEADLGRSDMSRSTNLEPRLGFSSRMFRAKLKDKSWFEICDKCQVRIKKIFSILSK